MWQEFGSGLKGEVLSPFLLLLSSSAKVILVSDNLNTHTKGAFYEAFEPKRARALARRVDFHHTPKHGRWLNIAENELNSLTRQCVSGRRLVDRRELDPTRRRLANESRRRKDQTQIRLPPFLVVKKSLVP